LSTSSRRVSNKLFLMIWDYYSHAVLDVPEDLPQREVALQTYDGKMIRHMSVADEEELKELVIKKKGIDLYVSTSSYQDPSAPSMDSKGWLRADIQFDIDVDHLPGCGPAYKVCGESVVPSSEDCAGRPVNVVPLPCLRAGFEQAKKLIDIIKRYFGISKDSAELHFSGNRGFHVVLRGTPFDEADQTLRREIADFVVGDLLKREIFCLEPDCLVPRPRLDDGTPTPGWIGRVGEVLWRMLGNGVRKWGEVDDPERVLEAAIAAARVEVDKQVTVDTSRLLRVPGSVHRKSALLVKKVSEFKWDEGLSPFKDYITFVKSLYSFDMDVLGKKVSLRKGEKAELSGAQGAFLASKGLVEILRFDRH